MSPIPSTTASRKVDTTGIITIMAGNGVANFAGDGGPATSASLNVPNAVVFDTARNLYIADSFNNRIRKFDTAGIITTVAGGAASQLVGIDTVTGNTSGDIAPAGRDGSAGVRMTV